MAASSLFPNVSLIIYHSQNAPLPKAVHAMLHRPMPAPAFHWEEEGTTAVGFTACLEHMEKEGRELEKKVRVVKAGLSQRKSIFKAPHPDRATTRSICKEFALICIKIALDFLNDPRNSPLILVTRIRILLQVRKGWVILLTACHATIIQMFTEGKRGLLSSPRTHG